jgi:hypothetical protein
MRVRAHRRNLVVWRSSVGWTDRYGAPKRTRLRHTGRIRRCVRTGALLSVLGLIRLTRAIRPRWRPLLAGVVLTVTGLMLRSVMWAGLAFPVGGLFLYAALLVPARSAADRKRHSELERELAGYSTPAQRWDLEATLARYQDSVTHELRDILASQAVAACGAGIPGARPR